MKKWLREVDQKIEDIVYEKFLEFEKEMIGAFREGINSRLSNKDIQVAGAIGIRNKKLKDIPETLYRYYGWDELKANEVIEGVLKKRTIKYAQAKFLNDPFELNPSTAQLFYPEFIEKHITWTGLTRHLSNWLPQSFHQKPWVVFYIPAVALISPYISRVIRKRIPHYEQSYKMN